ncbi:MAG: hypothetical protein O2890_14940 [Cyanobacteria bacterium]|nr:hypothetical protein [Cyanobacteriota bacterium]MDA0867666.1 hypothetical protein [Cyanobacteriota bacterium]
MSQAQSRPLCYGTERPSTLRFQEVRHLLSPLSPVCGDRDTTHRLNAQ